MPLMFVTSIRHSSRQCGPLPPRGGTNNDRGAKETLRRSSMLPTRPKKGDKIYVPGFAHITHGADDFEGGVVTVGDVRVDRIKGQEVAFVYIEEDESWVDW